MFYDTGIGKEGYSIIGQGQIDKILSGKPDERRELFDEAAGIVKFKRRKATAIKKLENERANLVRVNDILSELEKQVGPLQVQSEKAKEYLDYKADLKKYDVNAFLLESDRISKDLEELTGKIGIADNDLANSRAEYESTKAEYEEAEEQLSKVNSDIENVNSLLSNTELESQRLNGEINVITEQINRFTDNEKHYSDRIAAIDKDKAAKQTNVADFKKQLNELSTSVEEFENNLKAKQDTADVIKQDIDGVSDQIESRQNDIYDRLNAKSSINAENQKFATMLEQLNIRKAELNSHLIKDKSDEAEQNVKINDISVRLVTAIKNENADLNAQHDKIVQNYHREKSRLESLINITERYDGYGNSIRKIMELKDSNSGILGVIADIVKVERKYETAIETALGGTIQNIVTDKESTAKELIAYLKQNKLGRATFLPLNAISGRNTLEKEPCIKENGVIGIASNLVRVSFEYENLAKYLLGRILVVDNIDNALLIAKKYKYSLRIVTLEGEQLNPGGSMTGGAFKNSSNLLGRRREIEEIKKSVSELSKSSTELKTKIADNRAKIASIRELIDEDNKANREVSLAVNTEQMNLNQAKQKLSEIRIIYDKDKAETTEIDRQIKEIDENKNQVSGSLSALDIQNESSRKEIENLNKQLEAKKAELDKANDDIENLKIRFSSVEQKTAFIQENIIRINSEIAALESEEADIRQRKESLSSEVEDKNAQIEKLRSDIHKAKNQIEDCNTKITALRKDRDIINASHKTFFDKREKINEQIVLLEKESMRLHNQQEKLEEENDSIVDYMWNEYELTYSYAAELRSEELTDISDIKKQINILKANIKKLGVVNVNAIEEYKEVSERYNFLKTQHDDMIKAEEALVLVIDELDNGMRIQFKEKFEEIKVEFDKVFKELFGGGRGTIELVEGEDILEAGIVIISQPPGKKLQNMMQLSGGEKALTAIALLFAIQNLKPSPFCLLDEIEAALDDSNVGRYANYLHKLTKHTQFIVITHRRGTMAAADRLYGITMQEKGVSALVSVDLIANDLDKKKE